MRIEVVTVVRAGCATCFDLARSVDAHVRSLAHTGERTVDRPSHFRDTMVAGRFRSFEHDHFFTPVAEGTQMRDVLVFASPAGWLGRIVDRFVLAGYLRRLLVRRGLLLRDEAEAIARA